jgi:effector-binding domain-containing protein
MRFLKKLLIWLTVIIVLLVIISFFLPKQMHVERTATINAPAEAIFAQVNDYKNWEKWSPWHKKDPNMKLVYDGPTAGQGASYKWESEEVGNGNQKITASVPNDSIITEMYFMESKDPAYGKFFFAPSDSGTVLIWVMEMDNGMNPLSRWMSVLMKGMIEDDFEEGLANLKKVTEDMPAPSGNAQEVKIELSKSKDMTVATVKDSCSAQEISAKLGSLYGEIGAELGKNKAQMTGPVFAIYHSFSMDKVVLEAGVPVDKSFKTDAKNRVKVWDMKGTDVVLAHHYGSYESTEQTHYKMDEWLKKNNKTAVGAPWEVYITDPMVEKDTAKWYTQIYYPVK